MLVKLLANNKISFTLVTLHRFVDTPDVGFDGGRLSEELRTQRTLVPPAPVCLHVQVQPVVAKVTLAADCADERHLVRVELHHMVS